MRRRRARLIAAAIVFSVAVVSVAHGSFVATEEAAVSQAGAYGRPMAMFVSLRNTSAQSETIMSVTRSGSGNEHCPTHVNIELEPMSSPPVSVAAHQQRQFRVYTNAGFTAMEISDGGGSATCHWEATTSTGTVPFTTAFVASATPDTWHLTPQAMDFGSQSLSGSETQLLIITNHGATPLSYQGLELANGSGAFTFDHAPCTGQTTCGGSTVQGNGGQQLIVVKCDPSMVLSYSADLRVLGMGNAILASTGLSCEGLAGSGAEVDIQLTRIDIAGVAGMPTTIATNVDTVDGMSSMSNTLTTATITGTDAARFQLMGPGSCNMTQTCTFTPPATLPAILAVTCTPSTSMFWNATLTVTGMLGSGDQDTAPLTCAVGSGGPILAVSPSTLAIGAVPVGTGSAGTIEISNAGTGTLDALIEIGDPDWTADACVTEACAITSSTPRTVNVTFTPSVHGPRDTTLTVSANGTDETVALVGTGDGTRLEVQEPEDFEIDFGTLARDQLGTATITLSTMGTQGTTVTLGTAPPYSLSSALVSMGANDTQSVEVRCQSPTPGGPNEATITVGASSVYQQNTSAIQVRCTIADTQVQITPSAFDFGELRVGMSEVRIPFTISNPGPEEAALEVVRLSASRPGLTLTPIGEQTLPAGATVAGELALSSGEEVDLRGVFLVVEVDGEQLQLPIRGKVVTPSAYVTPGILDLGTACVGTQIDGTVLMVNDGTATLRVQPPLMDSTSFAVSPMTPASYPADLRAGDNAALRISPSTSAGGEVASQLTWDVDAPGAPFGVPVSLAYIDTGTALSPHQLGFGSIEVGELSPQQGLTLQNCDPAPSTITVRGVSAIRGPARAWVVTPVGLQTELGARDKLMVYVRFSPRRPGPHRARVELDVGGEIRFVDLEGVGRGELGDEDSFYACSCAGGSPLGGIPIAIGVAIIVWPVRRRRRLSGRCRSGSSSAR